MFKVVLDIKDEGEREVPYRSMEQLLEDAGMRALFDGGLVQKCTIYAGDARIAGLGIASWDRLKDAVASNSAAILRHHMQEGP